MKHLEALPMYTKFKLLVIALVSLFVAVTMRVWDHSLELAELEIQAVKQAEAQTEQESPVNRVELLRANYPEDWKPQYVYSEPGHTYYPEVIERQKKEEERARENAFERYLAEREMRK